MTQEELAERAQLSRRAIQELERGTRRRPRHRTVSALADALALDSPVRDSMEAAARLARTPAPNGVANAPPMWASRAVSNTRRDNLPAELTSYIGGDHEFAHLRQVLASARLLTFVGPGGVGKTRLAVRLASAVRSTYAAGVAWMDLAPLSDPTLLPQVILAVLGGREEGGRPTLHALRDAIGDGELLLILDNCEHLVQPCAELVVDLLRACSRLRVLATSREPLGIPGETIWRISPLRVPQRFSTAVSDLNQSEAVQLFVDRARAIVPEFCLHEDNAPSVAAVCRRLDGLPLALELAAARVNVLAVEQIARRLGDRMSLLVSDQRTVPARHKSLRATLDWSYELLSGDLQRCLQRMAVFTGSSTLEAIEAVCANQGLPTADVVDNLSELVSKSLVVSERDAEGEVRFRLLETVRQYAAERLSESGVLAHTQADHAAYYLKFAELAYTFIQGPQQRLWLRRLDSEHQNLRAALDWCLNSGESDTALRFGAALWRFWVYRAYLSEAEGWLCRLLQLPGPYTSTRLEVMFGAGGVALWRRATSLARVRFQALREASFEAGDARWLSSALTQLGTLHLDEAELSAAQELFEAALAIRRQDQRIEARWGVASDLKYLARVAFMQDDFEEARRLGQEALAIGLELGDEWLAGECLLTLAETDMRDGRVLSARSELLECLQRQQHLESPVGMLRALRGFADLAFAEGNVEQGFRFLGGVDALGDELLEVQPRPAPLVGRPIPSSPSARAAFAAGRLLTLDQAVAEAWASLVKAKN